MFIFLSIKIDAQNNAFFHAAIGGGRDGMFPATKDGAYALGRHIAAMCPGADEFSCSSDIDFADEFGVTMTSDEICNAVLLGMGCTVAAF